MKILEMRSLRGPNYWSIARQQLIVMKLDLQELEECPTDKIEGFYERLSKAMPSLYEHRCSEDHPGGFFVRVKEGTWMGHVVEHVALELQVLTGMETGFGRTRQTSKRGVYNVVYSYVDEEAGLLAGRLAVEFSDAIIKGTAFDLGAAVQQLKRIYVQNRPGPSTAAIIEAAKERDIPLIRLQGNSCFQLGYGSAQQRIEATITGKTSNIAVEIACNKNETKKVLRSAGIPVPQGTVVNSAIELQEAINELGFPLTLKPLNGNKGRGATLNVSSAEDAITALKRAQAVSKAVVVERYCHGGDYRFLVINYKLVAVAHRVPAMVVGNGRSTVADLIEQVNSDPNRGDGHEDVLTKIKVDEATMVLLREKNLFLNSVLPRNFALPLKQTANLSTGGRSIDVTDNVHPELKLMAERAAKCIGLDVCGIDLLATDISKPLRESGACVLEVNAAPGFRMHTHPSEGMPRAVGKPVVDMLFPGNNSGRIPITAITGTNGKTTTTRMIAHIVKQSGKRVGFTTTEGIYVDGFCIEKGDCTGPYSTGKILQDPTVEAAVLECARGGMLRSGLAFDRCDVGVITNIAEDHIGLGDINTLEDMARVKGVVAESVKKDGYAILNAGDDHCWSIRKRIKCNLALFGIDASNPRVLEHCRNGGLAAVLEEGFVTLIHGDNKIRIELAENLPASFGGTADFMIENMLAATLAAYCQGISIEDITIGLKTFVLSPENTPGRLNLFQFRNYSLLIDYVHNPHGLQALGKCLSRRPEPKLGIITGVGDRRDEDIIAMGRISAEIFDQLVIRLDHDTRGRSAENILELVKQGIFSVKPDMDFEVVPDEEAALMHAISIAEEGTMIVLSSEKLDRSLKMANSLKDAEEQQLRVEPVLKASSA